MGRLITPDGGPTYWRHRHERAGRIIWASGVGDLDVPATDRARLELAQHQLWTPNALADPGEQQMLDVYLRNATNPTNFYVRLYNDTPVDTDTLSTLTGEVSGTGYDPSADPISADNTGWPTLALDSGDYMATSEEVVFTAGGSWSAATYAVLATVATGTSGVLVIYNALGATRTLISGDTLTSSFTVKAA